MSYGNKSGGHNAMDPQLQQLDAAEAQIAAAMDEVRRSRQGRAGAPPVQVVKSYDAAANRFPKIFQDHSDFFHMVKSVGSNYMGWQSHPEAKKYVEATARHIDEHYKKSYRVHTKAAPSGLNETVGADGGFLVPPQFVQQLLMRTYENDLLSRTMNFPMTSNLLKLPAINETSRADGSRFGGVAAYWEGEAGEITASKPGLQQISIEANKVTLMVRATDELIEDSGTALQTFIEQIAAQELQFKIGDAIIRGDGVGKPRGIISHPCTVSVAKETGQPAATVLSQNVVKMWSRMFAPCRANAAWFINQDIEPSLLLMTLGVGTGGTVTYMPPGGLSGAPYATLMGRPVIPIEFASTLGTQGDIILADLSTYVTGTRGGMQSAVSMHVYFSSAEQVFRFIMRIGGRPWWSAPLTPAQGSATKSPFVVLDTRA